jgi:hypothetical protein
VEPGTRTLEYGFVGGIGFEHSEPANDTELMSPPSRKRNRINEEDRSELAKIDAAVERMRRHTQPDPYIVTIERDKKFQYEYQWKSQVYQWQRGMPFSTQEDEGIQYQSFVFHDPTSRSTLLSVQEQYYPEERPGTIDSTRNATGSHTPAQGPRKGISSDSYKEKQRASYPEESPGTVDSTRNATGSHTPTQGPRKVISFDSYKEKQRARLLAVPKN